MRLSNCPFHALSEIQRDLVCGMNLNLVEGVVEGMGATDLDARRDPRPGECCVTVRPKKKTQSVPAFQQGCAQGTLPGQRK